MLSESQPNSLPALTSDDSLPPVSRWTTICGLVLVSTVGIALTLAAIVKYPVKVTASATVRPAGETRLAQAPIEGTVESINVQENQVVRQGDVIATIDDSSLQVRRSQLLTTIQSSQSQLDRMDDQLSALATQRLAEANLMARAIASAQADLVRINQEYGTQRVTGQTGVQEAQAELELAQRTFARYQGLAQIGAVSIQERDEKSQALDVARAKLERARANSNPSAATLTVANERIAQERSRGESTLAVLDKERESLLQRRSELESQLIRDRKDLQQVESDIAKCTIRAPEDGTLLHLDLRNVGQVVRPAETVAQIAPSDVQLVVKARVDPQDRGKVALGQDVYLRVSAYAYPDYGILTGKVVSVSPDSTQAQTADSAEQSNAGRSLASYYEATIQPDKLYFRNDSQNSLQAGMEVTAQIVSRDETVLTFLRRKARLFTDM